MKGLEIILWSWAFSLSEMSGGTRSNLHFEKNTLPAILKIDHGAAQKEGSREISWEAIVTS
jgi:hypothetical protein